MSLRERIFGRGMFMETFSGGIYYPASPRASEVRLVDIAHHLSMICRFTGACRKRYDVAQHSIHVSYCVPPEHALAGLLHDAPEAYLNDMGRPLKKAPLMFGYRIYEHRNWLAIAEHFGLAPVLPKCVHYADNAVLLAERAVLMYPTGRHWAIPAVAADIAIHDWTPEQSEQAFLDRFYELTRGAPRGWPADGSLPFDAGFCVTQGATA